MTNETILVTGTGGLVGSAVVRALKRKGFMDVWEATRKVVDLENRDATDWFFGECKPAYVFHCAAKVGGIADNIREPATFLTANLNIQNNVMCAARESGVKKFLFVASAACYPELTAPLRPSDLMCGPLDDTKSGYAMAKLAGIQLCQAMRSQFNSDFISVIPNNVYGPGDRSSHVIPDLIRRFHTAKLTGEAVTCWGTGNARREFIHADDLADACVFLMNIYSGWSPVNVGAGEDWSLSLIAEKVAKAVGFYGNINWDSSKPEGALRRFLDSSHLFNWGWSPKIDLETGLQEVYKDFLCRAH